MGNSKIIIIEGAQGTGKTTVTDYLRHTMKYTNLYRLCGTSDSSIKGLEKSIKMYDNLMNYMENMENLSVNLLFDRTFFSEEVYCRLGYKEYTFSKDYNRYLEKLSKLDFEIIYITLYLKDESLFEERIQREGKAVPEYAKFKAENSINQQKEYLKIAEEVEEKYPNIKVVRLENGKDLEETKKELQEIIGFTF